MLCFALLASGTMGISITQDVRQDLEGSKDPPVKLTAVSVLPKGSGDSVRNKYIAKVVRVL